MEVGSRHHGKSVNLQVRRRRSLVDGLTISAHNWRALHTRYAIYVPDTTKAAHRHWDAAEALPDTNRGVAGYLYGLAAECAVKAIMEQEGLRPSMRRIDGDPFYSHFPKLQDALLDLIEGRGQARLMRFTQQSYMREWDIKMRYSDGVEINPDRVARWRNDAVVACAEL